LGHRPGHRCMRWPNNDSWLLFYTCRQHNYCPRSIAIRFYRAMLCMGLCPSVTSRCSIETAERIELVVFGTSASFHPSYTVLSGNSVHFKNKGTSLWNSVPNSRLKKFCFGILIVETCYQLSTRKVDAQSVINWTVVGQLSWQYLRAPALDHYSLSHRSESAVYSTILSHGSISDNWYLVQDLSYK